MIELYIWLSIELIAIIIDSYFYKKDKLSVYGSIKELNINGAVHMASLGAIIALTLPILVTEEVYINCFKKDEYGEDRS